MREPHRFARQKRGTKNASVANHAKRCTTTCWFAVIAEKETEEWQCETAIITILIDSTFKQKERNTSVSNKSKEQG